MKRWWFVYLSTGIGTAFLHLRLAGEGGTGDDVPTVLAHFGAAFLVYLLALLAARRLSHAPAWPLLLWCFLVSAVSLAAYLPSDLLLSEEVNRYRWDGAAARAGYNPYRVIPDDPELAAVRAELPVEIPGAQRKALYPPLAELLFYGMARLGTDHVLHYRILVSVTALLCGLLLLPLCRGAGVPAGRITVFLWHPLLVLETAANAHLETVGLFFLILSLAGLLTRHHLTPMATLALSILAKAYPLSIFPLYLRRVPVYRMVIFFVVLAAGAAPFLSAGTDLLAGFVGYVREVRFNPGFYLLAERLFEFLGRPGWTRGVMFLAGLVSAALLYITDDGSDGSILRRAFYLCLPPLLLGPVVKPWYLLWLIPFLALIRPENPVRMAFLYLSGSVVLAYLARDWGHLPGWVSALEYGPVYLLAGWGLWRGRRARPSGVVASAGGSVALRAADGC